MKKFLCFRIREHGDKAKSIWTHLDDSASEWSSFLGRRFLPLGSPASAGLFRTPALPNARGSTSVSEHELVEAATKVAAERYPELTEAAAFSKVFTASTEEARLLQHAVHIAKVSAFDVAPVYVGGVDAMHDANDDTEQSEAYAQLEAMAKKLRAAHPELSAEQAFAEVFTSPKNAALAAKAHKRPEPTTSYPFPR